MTQSHTPGPWHIEQFTSGYSKHEDRTISHRLENGNMFRIGRAYNISGPHETDANARLIAAAPEMLAALRMHAALPAWPDREALIKAMDATRAAIAKATGA